MTVGVGATETRARVDTMEVPTLFVGGAVSIDDTLWPACNIWVTKVFWNAATGGGTPLLAANCIVTAGRWVAGIHHFNSRWVGGLRVAGREGVSNEAWVTPADCMVVAGGTSCVRSTHSRTGVPALVVDARLVGGAVGVDGALMPALHVRVTLQSREADTGGRLVSLLALSVDATRGGVAWVYNFRSRCCGWRSPTLAEGIANVALVTDADGNMVSDVAVGVDTTQARTWVLALASDTGLVGRTVGVDHTLRPAVWR